MYALQPGTITLAAQRRKRAIYPVCFTGATGQRVRGVRSLDHGDAVNPYTGRKRCNSGVGVHARFRWPLAADMLGG